MRGENLNVAPGKIDEVRLELGCRIADHLDPLGIGKERQINKCVAAPLACADE
jgi:hypothetical protein